MNHKYIFAKRVYCARQAIMVSLIGMMMALYALAPWGTPHIALQKRFLLSSSTHEFSSKPTIKQINSHHKSDLETFLKRRLFSNDTHRKEADVIEIARMYPTRFSPDLEHLTNISSRKETFVNNLLPSILAHNEEVQAEREYLLMLKRIKDAGKKLNHKQTQWMNRLALKYKLRRITIAELLKRVDVIPPSLALGQAVVETGWGGSLAAQRFNSPFGMMKNSRHVFSYNSLQKSVSHYIHNLNTHDAYEPMRSIRAHLRTAGEHLCPLKLAEGLTRYSELGKTYTSRVKNIIKSFRLQQYDKARLSSFYQQS